MVPLLEVPMWTLKSANEGVLKLVHVVDASGRVVLYVAGSVRADEAMKIGQQAAALPDLIEALRGIRDWLAIDTSVLDPNSGAKELVAAAEAALRKAGAL